ncbi:CoA pyrophosphatase [Myxococcota bacterium]|nr:CoA pyrophosphatase [Myxococcota bacterium]
MVQRILERAPRECNGREREGSRPRYAAHVDPTSHPFDDNLRRDVANRLAAFEQHTENHFNEEVARSKRPLRRAAVAVTLISNEQGAACFLITRRASSLRNHAGQWALPGGRLDEGETHEAAALRELHEELGLELAPNTVLGRLDAYGTRSGFVITPIVLWGEGLQTPKPDPNEVAAVYSVPLFELDRPDVPIIRTIPESDRPVVSVPLLGTVIHAPTAAFLLQLRDVGLRGLSTRVHQYEQPVFAWR